jgi:chromosome segregation ATPase
LAKDKEKLEKQNKDFEQKTTELETQNKNYCKEVEQLTSQLKDQKQAVQDISTTKESTKQLQAEQQKIIKDKEEIIRDLKLQVKEKESTIEEMDSEHKNSEKERESKLADAEAEIKSLTKKISDLEKSNKRDEKHQSSIKQKLEMAEQDLKKKEKEIKSRDEQKEALEKEISVLKSKLQANEKQISGDYEEITALKMKLGSFSTSIFAENLTKEVGSSGAEERISFKEPSEAIETAKLRKQLDDVKLELAVLNGRYLENCKALTDTKSKCEKLEKENEDMKRDLANFETMRKKVEEFDIMKKQNEELASKCKDLQRIADEKSELAQQAVVLQSQFETLKNQNQELKDALYQAENKLIHYESAGSVPNQTPTPSEEKKINIREEMKQYLAEVIYVYTTLGTNSRMFKEQFMEKRQKLERYKEIAQTIGAKKNNDKIALFKELAPEFSFINAIQIKNDTLKLLLLCLQESINNKLGKMETYDDQITKFEQMINVAKAKIEEYQEKLNLF